MAKTRILKVTGVDGSIEFVIQQKHWLFFWTWCSAWINSWDGACCRDTFPTLEEAQKNLCYFDGSVYQTEIVG